MTDSVSNPQFAEVEGHWWDLAKLGGCPICWGKGKWLGITDGDWSRLGHLAPRTVKSCPYCRGSGLDPHPTQAAGKDRAALKRPKP